MRPTSSRRWDEIRLLDRDEQLMLTFPGDDPLFDELRDQLRTLEYQTGALLATTTGYVEVLAEGALSCRWIVGAGHALMPVYVDGVALPRFALVSGSLAQLLLP